MAKSSITAFCASKNVLCSHKDRRTQVQIFCRARATTHRYGNELLSRPAGKIIKSNEKPLLPRKQIRSKGGKTLLNFTLEASAAVPYLSNSANITHGDGGFDMISRGGRTAGHMEVCYTSSYETWFTERLCHTGKPSPVIIPLSLDHSRGLQPGSTSRSSTSTC